MTTNLSPPDSNQSYAVAADWLELLALSRSSGISSSQDLIDAEGILFDPAELDESAAASDDIDLDILNPQNEEILDAVCTEIGFRADCLGERYPFALEFNDRRLRVKLASNVDNEPVKIARNVYTTCLLMSCVRFGLLNAAKAKLPADPHIGNFFQLLATAAAAGYVGGDAYLFGHPRPDQTPMLNAVQKLSALMNAGTPAQVRPAGMAQWAKDGGIDVVAWRDHVDLRPSKTVLFGQCASGRNWPGKSVIGYVKEFRHYFDRFISEHWLPAIFVPFQIYAEKENAHQLSSNEDRAAYYLTQESSMGVIVDRIRLVHWASSAWDRLPPSANESLKHIEDVWKWHDQALKAAKAA